jgi:hypothetical protein
VPLVLYALVLSYVTAHHEMWHDELQQWGIAAASESPLEVVENLRFESTPPLWHLCLFGVTRVTRDPRGMQVLHVVLATLAMAVFLVAAPFPRWQRVLFVFGYWSLFEFGVVSRSYVLGETFFFSFLALYPWAGRRSAWAGAALFLLSQTSFFGLVLAAGGVLAMLLWHYCAGSLKLGNRALVVGLGIACVGAAGALWQIRQHPRSAVHTYWEFVNLWNALRTATIPWRALIPIPSIRREFWNTNILDTFQSLEHATGEVSMLVQGSLSVLIVLVTVWLIRRRPEILGFYLTVTLGCLAFFYTKKLGYGRHHAHLFLAWVGALWMLVRSRGEAVSEASFLESGGQREATIASRLFTVVLLAGVAASAYACVLEVRHPFSSSHEAAKFVRARRGQNEVIVSGPQLAALLDCEVYLLPNDRLGRYYEFSLPFRHYKPTQLAPVANRLAREHGKRCLLAIAGCDVPNIDKEYEIAGYRRIAEWLDCLVPTEKYVIFEAEDTAPPE